MWNKAPTPGQITRINVATLFCSIALQTLRSGFRIWIGGRQTRQIQTLRLCFSLFRTVCIMKKSGHRVQRVWSRATLPCTHHQWNQRIPLMNTIGHSKCRLISTFKVHGGNPWYRSALYQEHYDVYVKSKGYDSKEKLEAVPVTELKR